MQKAVSGQKEKTTNLEELAGFVQNEMGAIDVDGYRGYMMLIHDHKTLEETADQVVSLTHLDRAVFQRL